MHLSLRLLTAEAQQPRLRSDWEFTETRVDGLLGRVVNVTADARWHLRRVHLADTQ